MFLYGTFLCLRDSTEAGAHSETVAMAKRLVLLTMEHIVVLSHVNDQDTKERAPAAPVQSRQCWGLSPLTHAFTQHGKAFLSESLTPWVLRTGLWRHL